LVALDTLIAIVGPVSTKLVSVGVSVAFFLIFEIWFSVPLPKGPLESALGLG